MRARNPANVVFLLSRDSSSCANQKVLLSSYGTHRCNNLLNLLPTLLFPKFDHLAAHLFLFWATDSINHRVGTHLKFFKDATLPDLPQILHPGPQQPPAEGVQRFHRKPLQLLQEGRPKLGNQWPIIEVEVDG